MFLLVAAACRSNSGSKSGNRNTTSTAQTGEVAPAQAPGTTPVGRPVRPGTPAGREAASSPTPVATCAPGDLLRLVSKETALPAEYVPHDLIAVQPIDSSPNLVLALKLRREAEEAMHHMLEQARASSLSIVVQSAYRGYQDQQQVYQQEVETFGQAQADRESARPGHSEHQLGLAVDFTSKRLDYDLNDSFAATAEGNWLQQNASQYGFVLSYPLEKEASTGYMYEPWHYRYVGPGTAQAVAQSGQTLNQWLAGRQLGCHG